MAQSNYCFFQRKLIICRWSNLVMPGTNFADYMIDWLFPSLPVASCVIRKDNNSNRSHKHSRKTTKLSSCRQCGWTSRAAVVYVAYGEVQLFCFAAVKLIMHEEGRKEVAACRFPFFFISFKISSFPISDLLFLITLGAWSSAIIPHYFHYYFCCCCCYGCATYCYDIPEMAESNS